MALNFNEYTGLKILKYEENLDIHLNRDNLYLHNQIIREQLKLVWY